MSGPKGGSYSYVDPALAARRREEAAFAAARGKLRERAAQTKAFAAKVASARAAYAVADIDIPSIDTSKLTTSGTVEAEIARIDDALRLAETQLATSVQEARTAMVVTTVEADPIRPDYNEEAHREAVMQATSSAPIATERRSRVSRLVTRLHHDASADVVDRIATVARGLIEASTGPSEADVLVLQGAIDRANEDVQTRHRNRLLLEALVERLATESEFEDVARILVLVETALESPITPDDDLLDGAARSLTAQAAIVLDAARLRRESQHRDEERELVAAALRDSFAALGYDLQEGFVTSLSTTGVAHARDASEDMHAIQVRIDDPAKISMFVIADGSATSAAEDIAAEERFCSTIPQLQSAAARRGVQIVLTSAIEAGAVPVPHADLDQVFGPSRRATAERVRKRT